jgi:hypothetical protein
MTNAINTVGLTQAVPQQASPAGSVVSANADATVTPSSDSKPLIRDSSTPISPRIVVDPQAGVITEFLNTSGQVESQIPSSTVVAYLRAGLNANGEAKPSTVEPANTKPGDTIVA